MFFSLIRWIWSKFMGTGPSQIQQLEPAVKYLDNERIQNQTIQLSKEQTIFFFNVSAFHYSQILLSHRFPVSMLQTCAGHMKCMAKSQKVLNFAFVEGGSRSASILLIPWGYFTKASYYFCSISVYSIDKSQTHTQNNSERFGGVLLWLVVVTRMIHSRSNVTSRYKISFPPVF